MSLKMKALKNGSWFAFFKLISQTISWGVTIVIARLLFPDDYALSAMATIITSYAEIFSQLGLGASIIQREKQTQKDLSSVFWFALSVSLIFAISCFPFSYLTAYIFNEPKVIPLVQAISVLFIFSGLQIVPLNLLKRDINFKSYGMIEMVTTIISSIGMVVIAYYGGGVWALIGGRIIRGVVRLVAVYYVVRWMPLMHFNYEEAKHYLKFGAVVALGSSAFYIFEMSDRFFAGRAWSLENLGFYLFALQLAQMPTEKIVSLINQVSYPVFSQYQSSPLKFNALYLQTIRFTTMIVFPFFVGGFFIGEELIAVLLGDKWMPIVTLFEFLCLVQVITTLNALNSHVHMSLGKPLRGLYFHVACAIFMSISFYYAVQYDMEAILYPWFTTYFILTVIWVIFTLKVLGISFIDYFKSILSPLVAVIIMSIPLMFLEHYKAFLNFSMVQSLILKVGISGIIYISYFWVFDREIFHIVKKLKNA